MTYRSVVTVMTGAHELMVVDTVKDALARGDRIELLGPALARLDREKRHFFATGKIGRVRSRR